MADSPVSSLSVLFTGDVSPLSGSLTSGVTSLRNFRSAVDQTDASLGRMAATSGKSMLGSLTSGIGTAISTLARLTGAAGLAAAAVGSVFALGKGFNLASEFETAAVQLTALSGSATVANSTLGQLRDLAAHSPFGFPELLDASKRLLAVGVAASGIPTLLREVGDVAAGTGTPIGEIADQFARVAAEGSLGSRELLALGRDGVPVLQVLAKQFNTTAAGVEELAAAGRIGFAQLEQAFESMTGPGGRFSGIVAAQAQTIGGLLHNLSATVDDTLADVAESLVNAFDLRPALAGMAAAVGRVGPVIVGGLNAAAPYIHQFGADAVDVFARLYAVTVPVFQTVASGIVSAWGPVSAFIASHADTIRAALGGVGSALVAMGLPTLLGAAGAAASLVVGAVVTLAGALVSPVAGALALGAAAGVLVERFGLVGKATALVSEAATYVSENWQSMVGVVATVGAGLYSVVAGAFTAVAHVSSVVWTAVAGVVEWAWDKVAGLTSSAASALASAFGGISINTQGLANAFTVATAVAGYSLSHLGEVAKLAAVTVAANLAELVGQVQWAFTTAAPAYITWFATNAIGVLASFYESAKDTFTGVVTAAASTLANLPDLIRGKVNLSDIWKDVGTSFAVSFSALPQIADRQMGAVEQALRGAQDDLTKNMAGGMADAVAKQQAEATAAAKRMTDAISGVIAGAKPAELAKPTIKAPDAVKVKPTLDPSNLSLGITPEIKRPKAMLAGSAEAVAAQYDAGHVLPSVLGARPQSLAPTAPGMASAVPPAMATGSPASSPPPVVTAPTTSTAAAADTVRDAMKAWQSAAQQARTSDSVGGAQHRADQLAAQQALAQLRAAQAQRDAAAKTVTATTTAPQHGAPIAGVTHHDAPDAGDPGSIADYLKTRPDLARDMAADRLRPPDHARVQYAAVARPELSDAMRQPDGTYRVRSQSTGMSAVVDADAAGRLDSEARKAATASRPTGPQGQYTDAFTQWKASRDAAMAGTAGTVPPPRPEPKPSSPGVDATRREASTAAATKQLNEAQKGTGLLTKIEANTRSQQVTIVSMS